MSTSINNKYAKLKNYELEVLFDLSKKEKAVLNTSIDARTKHYLKLQEFYLLARNLNYEQLETQTLEYLNHHGYLLDKQMHADFLEMLASFAHNINTDVFNKYIKKAINYHASLYTIKHAVYNSILNSNIYQAARYMLIAVESEIEFDGELGYYNLIVEHFFEDDILEYAKVMAEYQNEYISVNNISVEFSFNKLITNYHIQKNVNCADNHVQLEAKKAINELVLKTISSMKDENQMRAQVLRAREALYLIDSGSEYNIFDLITFYILPKPSGEPAASPFNKLV